MLQLPYYNLPSTMVRRRNNKKTSKALPAGSSLPRIADKPRVVVLPDDYGYTSGGGYYLPASTSGYYLPASSTPKQTTTKQSGSILDKIKKFLDLDATPNTKQVVLYDPINLSPYKKPALQPIAVVQGMAVSPMYYDTTGSMPWGPGLYDDFLGGGSIDPTIVV